MTAIEELGLLKMDFLGLRNLSVIEHAQELIRRKHPQLDVEKLPEGGQGDLHYAVPGVFRRGVPVSSPGA